jgi:phosphopantetheine adenylyltransferase
MLTKEDIIQKIRDDLYLTGKQAIMDDLPENQNALFIGKLRIPTVAHIGIIESALKEFNHVVVCIVKAVKDEKESLSFEKQREILESVFGNKITVITYSTGNITSIINKSPKRVRYVLAGSDRVEGYKVQLEKHPAISVVETKRDMGLFASKENNYVIVQGVYPSLEKGHYQLYGEKRW